MWFDPSKILKHEMLLNFVVSERGSGKTFSTMKYCVERFLKHREQFVYMRRTETELETAAPSILNQLQVKGYFKKHEFKHKGAHFIVDDMIAGYAIPISTAYKLKSVAFPQVRWLVFDEFISENGKYLKDEVRKFLSVYETIGRMRDDIQVLFLGNAITNLNPYWCYWQVKQCGKPRADDGGSKMTRYRDKSILLYDFVSPAYRKAKKATKFGKLISGTEYGEFMLNNTRIMDDESYIDKCKGRHKTPMNQFILEGKNIVCYEIWGSSERLMWYAIRNPLKELRVVNFDEVLRENTAFLKVTNSCIYKTFMAYIKMGMVRFESMEVKDILCRNLL